MRRLGVSVGLVAALAAIGAGALARPAEAADEVVDAIVAGSVLLLGESMFVPTPTKAEPDFVSVEGGRFDPIENVAPSNEFGLEYRFGSFWWKFKPFVGAYGDSRDSFWGYGGIRLDTYWGRRIIITPSFAAVGYARMNGKNLGSPVVFRSGFDFQYRFDNDMRVGVGFHHMSMGQVFGSYNPGTELVGVTFSMPVKTLMHEVWSSSGR